LDTAAGTAEVGASERDVRIGPEPLSAVLPALAAIGALSSIAAINWVANDKPDQVQSNRRRVSAALRDMDRVCAALEDVLARLNRFFSIYVGERGGLSSPLKFGVYGLRIPQNSFPVFQTLISDTSNVLRDASQVSFEVMCLIEEGTLEPPEEFYFELGEAQERLTALMRERSSLSATLEESAAIAAVLTEQMRHLKEHRTS